MINLSKNVILNSYVELLEGIWTNQILIPYC